MGLVEIIPGVLSAPTGRLAYNDKLLCKGSLLLFDPAHSLGAFDGVPAYGDTMPNVAWDLARDIIGSGTQATLAALPLVTVPIAGAAIFERSGRGGLHGIYSRVTTGTNSFGVRAPATIADYLFANSDHDLFIGGWMRVTRNIGTTSSTPQAPMHFASTTSSYHSYISGTGGYVPTSASAAYLGGASGINARAAEAGAAGRMMIAATAWTGAKPATRGSITPTLASGAHGAWGGANAAAPLGAIVERFYIEDMTVSGRTYAEVSELFDDMFNTAHADGGTWFGDTWTDPMSIDA